MHTHRSMGLRTLVHVRAHMYEELHAVVLVLSPNRSAAARACTHTCKGRNTEVCACVCVCVCAR